MDPISNVAAAMGLGILGWWLLESSRSRNAWVGVTCLLAAGYFAVSAVASAIGMDVALSAVLGVGLWFVGLRLLLTGDIRDRYLAVAILAAGTMMVATGVLVHTVGGR